MNLLKTWLQKKNYEVAFTGDKRQVISLIQIFDPQLILIDVLHREIVEKIKMTTHIDNIPILLMTGYTHPGSNAIAGVDDTIEKPFDLSLLELKIKRLMPSGIQL